MKNSDSSLLKTMLPVQIMHKHMMQIRKSQWLHSWSKFIKSIINEHLFQLTLILFKVILFSKESYTLYVYTVITNFQAHSAKFYNN